MIPRQPSPHHVWDGEKWVLDLAKFKTEKIYVIVDKPKDIERVVKAVDTWVIRQIMIM